MLGLNYPSINCHFDNKLKKYFLQNDEKLIQAKPDFIGLQNYTREIVKHSYFVPYIYAKNIDAKKRKVKATEMNWEVYPPSIYEMLKKFNKYKDINKIIITENGAAFKDKIIDNKIFDIDRINYIKNHLQQVLLAKEEGVKVEGYFIWSFIDNFEWAEGYNPCFGIVHFNSETQERIVKSSGEWYKSFLAH